MAKTCTTEITFKRPVADGMISTFTSPDVYSQILAGRDVHTFVTEDGVQKEVFIPYEAILKATLTVTDGDSTTVTDAFCGGEA